MCCFFCIVCVVFCIGFYCLILFLLPIIFKIKIDRRLFVLFSPSFSLSSKTLYHIKNKKSSFYELFYIARLRLTADRLFFLARPFLYLQKHCITSKTKNQAFMNFFYIARLRLTADRLFCFSPSFSLSSKTLYHIKNKKSSFYELFYIARLRLTADRLFFLARPFLYLQKHCITSKTKNQAFMNFFYKKNTPAIHLISPLFRFLPPQMIFYTFLYKNIQKGANFVK